MGRWEPGIAATLLREKASDICGHRLFLARYLQVAIKSSQELLIPEISSSKPIHAANQLCDLGTWERLNIALPPVPKEVHALIPGAWDCVPLHSKRILQWESSLHYPGGPDAITGVLIRGRQELSKRRQCDNRSRDCRGAARSQRVWTASRSGAGKEQILPWDLQKKPPSGHLIFGSIRLMCGLVTPRPVRINVCSFEPPVLLSPATAAIGNQCRTHHWSSVSSSIK